jgi:hypothetical protein
MVNLSVLDTELHQILIVVIVGDQLLRSRLQGQHACEEYIRVPNPMTSG